MDPAGLRKRMEQLGYAGPEAGRLAGLMGLFADLPPPPDPLGLYPDYAALLDRFQGRLAGPDDEALEESFLDLYAHLHGHEAPYTAAERQRMNETGGYWNHAGGLSPVLKAPDHIGRQSVTADFGAGNGLQCLLMQRLCPHRLSVQFEISSQAVAAGRELQRWLGVEQERVDWVVGDVLSAPTAGLDFIYLYRPVRPQGAGEAFYRRFSAELSAGGRPVVIFSVADCLRSFLPASFEIFYSDGHLTCYRLASRRPPLAAGGSSSQPSK